MNPPDAIAKRLRLAEDLLNRDDVATALKDRLVAAPIAGAMVGALLAWFAVSYRVNQIIVGVVLNVLVIGVTNSGGATVSEFMGPLNGQNPLFTRSGTVTLEQGQFLAFIVNEDNQRGFVGFNLMALFVLVATFVLMAVISGLFFSLQVMGSAFCDMLATASLTSVYSPL